MPGALGRRTRHGPLPSAVRRAVRRHVLLTALVSVVLAVAMTVGVWLVTDLQGHRTARQVSTQVAGALVVPFGEMDFGALTAPDRVELAHDVAPFLVSDLVHRVKVWRREGEQVRVVFSDEPQVEGAVDPVDPELARRLAAGEAVSQPLPADDEHRFELASGEPLIEVFIGFADAARSPMWLEIYVPVDTATATWHTLAVLLPVTLTALLALGAATVPLTLQFARRLEREQQERRAALRYGLAASDLQRHELAQLLHDGVIQDLAGAGMLLDALRGADTGHAPLLEKARLLVEDDIRQLRDLAAELMPVALDEDDLRTAIAELAQRLGGARTGVEVDVRGVAPEHAVLVHRVVRELLRNAFRHGRASRVDVRVHARPDELVLRVADDGVGFDATQPAPVGHIGLRLVTNAVEEAGGTVTVTTAPGAGTAVEAALPRL